MQSDTRRLWEEQDRHPGDRWRLFRTVASIRPGSVLYPGCFVDITPSFVFQSVTYVDADFRARDFFADDEGVREIITSHDSTATGRDITFLHADYTGEMGLRDESFDLLVSLYAGPVSRACGRYLRVGGTLLANPSHGDVALASLDPRFRLAGVIESAGADGYRLRSDDLDLYLIPKSGRSVTSKEVEARGRGVAYTRSPYAYLFERVA